MREAHPLERAFGVGYYVSDADGVGGRLRERVEDFRVRELEAFDTQPVDAPYGAYPHLVFRATLHGWDTNGFASQLSKRLGISRERVTWSGTKDKRAVTTQLFSLRDWEGEPSLPDLPRAELSVVGRAGRPVLFGDHRGNEFEIVVRDTAGDPAPVTEELAAFAGASAGPGADREQPHDGESTTVTVGVPNWFGQQRFGTRRPVTHEVGLAVVRGDWEGAVRAYLGGPDDREPEATRAARRFVDESVEGGATEWQAALERFPTALSYERSMIHRLVENGGDQPEHFRHALESVATNLQQLFVNAAQSALFNRVCTRRLARGLPFDRPVAGDVVCFTDEDGQPDPDRAQRVDADRLDVVARHCRRGRAFVTAPLVGTGTELGDGEPGEIERAVLAEAGIEPGDFDLPGEFGSAGTRRAILVRTDVSVERDPLTLAFTLPSGSYATVLLREYMKTSPERLA